MNTKGNRCAVQIARREVSLAPVAGLHLECPDARFQVSQPRLNVGSSSRPVLSIRHRAHVHGLAGLPDDETGVAQLADRGADDGRGHAEGLGQAGCRRQLAAHWIDPGSDRGPQPFSDLDVLGPASVIDHSALPPRRPLCALCTWCMTATRHDRRRCTCLVHKEYYVRMENKVKEW